MHLVSHASVLLLPGILLLFVPSLDLDPDIDSDLPGLDRYSDEM
jgi:hypothetical protein